MSGAYTKRRKALVAPLTEVFLSAYRLGVEHIQSLDDASLRELHRAVQVMNQTNCGWHDYEVGRIFAYYIKERLRDTPAGRAALALQKDERP